MNSGLSSLGGAWRTGTEVTGVREIQEVNPQLRGYALRGPAP